MAGGLEPTGPVYGPSLAPQYATVRSFWKQGVHSIYLFNFDCHRMKGRAEDYTPQEIEALQILGDPEALARQVPP